MHGILNCYLRGVRTASVMDVYRCIDFYRCLYTHLYIHIYILYIIYTHGKCYWYLRGCWSVLVYNWFYGCICAYRYV